MCGTPNPNAPNVTVMRECNKCQHRNSEFASRCAICDSPLFGHSGQHPNPNRDLPPSGTVRKRMSFRSDDGFRYDDDVSFRSDDGFRY